MAQPQGVQRLFRPHLVEVQTYQGTRPAEVVAAEGLVPSAEFAKLDGNENPYGPSPKVLEALARGAYNLYPDPQQGRVRRALADYTSLGPEHVVVGAGSDELIDLLLRLLLEPGDRVIDLPPTFGMYSFNTRVCGGTTVSVSRDQQFRIDVEGIRREARDPRTKAVFITSPNNPTGNSTLEGEVLRVLEAGILVVVDETYYEFSGRTVAHLVPQHENLVVLRSLSKWAALAGLRVGYGLMSPPIAEVLLRIKPPYNISVAAELALLASLEDKATLLGRVQTIVRERERLFAALAETPGVFQVWPSEGNFLLCCFAPGQALQLRDKLARRGVLLRHFTHPAVRDCLRITVGTPQHSEHLLQALREVLA